MVHTVAWTMGKQRRVTKEIESQTPELPPPGNYGYPKEVGKHDDPKWSFGKDNK